jgi:hypothetical protein
VCPVPFIIAPSIVSWMPAQMLQSCVVVVRVTCGGERPDTLSVAAHPALRQIRCSQRSYLLSAGHRRRRMDYALSGEGCNIVAAAAHHCGHLPSPEGAARSMARDQLSSGVGHAVAHRLLRSLPPIFGALLSGPPLGLPCGVEPQGAVLIYYAPSTVKYICRK